MTSATLRVVVNDLATPLRARSSGRQRSLIEATEKRNYRGRRKRCCWLTDWRLPVCLSHLTALLTTFLTQAIPVTKNGVSQSVQSPTAHQRPPGPGLSVEYLPEVSEGEGGLCPIPAPLLPPPPPCAAAGAACSTEETKKGGGGDSVFSLTAPLSLLLTLKTVCLFVLRSGSAD